MSSIPDTAVWVIINAIRQGCQCKACARVALVKALDVIDGTEETKVAPYTSGAVWTNPTTFTNWESK